MDYRQKALEAYQNEEQRLWEEWKKAFFAKAADCLDGLDPDDVIFTIEGDYRYAQIRGIPELYFYNGWANILVRSHPTDDQDAFSHLEHRSVFSWADVGHYLEILQEQAQ